MQKLRKVLVVTVALGLLLGSVSAYAITLKELDQRIKDCAAIGNATARLQAYDALAESLGLSPALSPGDKGKWLVDISTDPIDDSKIVNLVLPCTSGTNSDGNPIYLFLRYESGKTEAFIVWGQYLGENLIDVTWRFGNEQAETGEWLISTDGKATFYPPYDVIAFIKKLLTVNRFVVRLTPPNESPITAVFDLRGLKNAIPPLREAAGW